MPKIVEYPLASFDKVKQLADAVDYLGGSCTIRDCAEHMKKKVSGGFGILVSSGIKHDLLVRRSDRLFTSDLYKKIKLAYNAAETLDYQRMAFFHPVLYKKISDRFRNKELPLAMLDKLLIREFQVEENVSQKIAGFFVDGVKSLQLLKDGKLVNPDLPSSHYTEDNPPSLPAEENHQSEINFNKTRDKVDNITKINDIQHHAEQRFIVSIKGNGVDLTIVVNDKDDYQIIEAMIGKIKKTLV